jgi:hypothetical protein
MRGGATLRRLCEAGKFSRLIPIRTRHLQGLVWWNAQAPRPRNQQEPTKFRDGWSDCAKFCDAVLPWRQFCHPGAQNMLQRTSRKHDSIEVVEQALVDICESKWMKNMFYIVLPNSG